MGFDVVVSNKGGVRSTPVLCTLNIYMSTLYIESGDIITGPVYTWDNEAELVVDEVYEQGWL